MKHQWRLVFIVKHHWASHIGLYIARVAPRMNGQEKGALNYLPSLESVMNRPGLGKPWCSIQVPFWLIKSVCRMVSCCAKAPWLVALTHSSVAESATLVSGSSIFVGSKYGKKNMAGVRHKVARISRPRKNDATSRWFDPQVGKWWKWSWWCRWWWGWQWW